MPTAVDARLPQDVTGAEDVEIVIRSDGRVIWVNLDGLLLLRICRIKNVRLIDERREE